MLLAFLLSAIYLLYLPFIACIVILVIILAATGNSLGTREALARALVRVFEWGSEFSESSEFEEGWDEEDEKQEEKKQEERPPSRLRRRRSSADLRIIKREHSELLDSKLSGNDVQTKTSTVSVIVDDCFDFITAGMESIIEDQVTSRFSAERLPSWNLLSRTKYSFEYINWKLSVLWILGFLVRYLVLVPIRVCLFFVALSFMVIITSLVGYVPFRGVRKWLNRRAMLMCMRIFARSFSSIVRFHNRENRANHGGICVANHTSPVDVMILSTDNCYAMIGQQQGGILGFIQRSLSKAEHHIWFERSQASDRKHVSDRMREHVEDSKKLPIIIFPEGTCINNTSVMMFKKGSFEISATIYPIAMKYDSRLGDAFWNSSQQSYGEYLWMMMTSWAIICDVWYLPPMSREEGEDSIAFARRVKKAIAKAGGLVDLEWDGNLKREKVSSRLINLQQKIYYDRLTRRTSMCDDDIPDERINLMEKVQNLSQSEQEQLYKTLDGVLDDKVLLRKVSEYVPEAIQFQSELLQAEKK